MTQTGIDLSWNLFTDPPDDAETRWGALLVNYNGYTARDPYDLAVAYRAAGFRLLDAASESGEHWESVDPILFCFRHALELNLKALHRQSRQRVHGLTHLADALHERLRTRYTPAQLDWLRDRIREFGAVDPKSTVFRYDDVARSSGPPELWVDLQRLRHTMTAMFEALDTIRRHDLDSARAQA